MRSVGLLRPGDTVLFQGDSITDAFRKPDEINNAYQLGNGYVLMVAGELLRSRPGDGLRIFNRGVAGQTLADLRARWEQDVIALQPSVLSLLVGINDTGQEVGGNTARSPAQFARDYRAALRATQAAVPGVRFVLCEPFALPCGLVGEDWLAPLARRQEIVAALAQEFQASFVPLQGEFNAAARRAPPTYWIYDGIHPTAPGHQLIAHSWLQAVGHPVRRGVPVLRQMGARPRPAARETENLSQGRAEAATE